MSQSSPRSSRARAARKLPQAGYFEIWDLVCTQRQPYPAAGSVFRLGSALSFRSASSEARARTFVCPDDCAPSEPRRGPFPSRTGSATLASEQTPTQLGGGPSEHPSPIIREQPCRFLPTKSLAIYAGTGTRLNNLTRRVRTLLTLPLPISRPSLSANL